MAAAQGPTGTRDEHSKASGEGASDDRQIVEKRTFCRVCEPACGMIASVDGETLVGLRADKAHPVSQGFVCNKGIYGLDIHNDPDRLQYPLRRNADGELERASWNGVLSEISERLTAIKAQHGASALAFYGGNPGAFNTLLGPSQGSFLAQLGVRKHFSSGTQDCANKFAASRAVFGTRTLHPVPDIDHSDFILIIGENPAVSHMSFVSIPHPMKHLKAAEQRGATVLYVNPRDIESASIAGAVQKIKPDTDVYLLAALLQVIDTEIGFHADVLQRGQQVDALRAVVAGYPPERVSAITGIEADGIRALAHGFAAAPSACVHMSTGVNMGRQGSLSYWLVHMLALVTGNLGRRGGNIYSRGFYSRAAASGSKGPEELVETGYGLMRKPGGGVTLPGNLMADYLTDTAEPVKALFVSSGNPVLSIGGEQRMRDALDALELLVCIDIYPNATSQHADFVLPAAGAFEREDVNLTGLGLQFVPSIQFTEAVVPPAYERKPDWWIWEKLAQHMGFVSAFDQSETPDMWGRIDAMLRCRDGSMAELRAAGILTFEHAQPEHLFAEVQHEDGLVDCCPAIFESAIERMAAIFEELSSEGVDTLKLISKRDAYMLNSWYSNLDKLKHGKRDRNYLFMHPQDAERRQIADGERVRISNAHGVVETEVRLSADYMQGVVAMTHGWGHGGNPRLRVARDKPGVNCNVLLPSGPGSFEPLSNQAHMTGIAVEVSRAATR
ncbi:MAG: molybdopterin-dependent oxidoreductase [Pseudomonadota bacterium]